MSALESRVPINIEDEMRQSYINYAMSVIVGRALPDIRDGLKPVHRRVLYAMNELNLAWNRPYKKSARVVGDVIGKYHPHGDTAVYDAIVRMAQDFSMRNPLVDGQGNFGSVDGDAAAAMRYTEVRMTRFTQELLADIEKGTVDFVPNYDGSLEEPLVLPARVPNLLVNGSSGIAVGMATNIPPHNLGEVIDGLILLLEKPEASLYELVECVKGPDFPTKGYICGYRGIIDAYRTGRGSIQMRARSTVEQSPKGGKQSIIINQLPYQVNKARLIEKIAELVKDKKIEGITDIRDESDRQGMRIVIELRRDESDSVILNKLFKHTQLQCSFGVILLALVDGRPQVLGLKKVLHHFIEFRKEVILRRTRFDLEKAREKVHLLEGLKIALDNLEAIIELIRRAESPPKAKEDLMSAFSLSAVQAQGILEMRLQRLTGLEREKILEDLRETVELVRELEGILGSEEQVKEIIKEELLTLKNEYSNKRLTEILPEEIEMASEDLIAEEDMIVTVTHSGYIKRTPVYLYRSQHRGGKGLKTIHMREKDFVRTLFMASTHDYILFFTNIGKVHWLKVYGVPEAGRLARGKPLVNLLTLQEIEKVTAILNVREFSEDQYLLMATRKGVVKRSSLAAFGNPRSLGIIAINLDPEDELVDVKRSEGQGTVLLATREGQAIRFHEEEVRSIGRSGRGVATVVLEKGDQVVSAELPSESSSILTVCEKGYGKRTKVSEYSIQGRRGKGRINIRITQKNGKVVSAHEVQEENELIIITSEGKSIRLKVSEIPEIGRITQGVRLIDLSDGDKVVATALVGANNDEDEEINELDVGDEN